MRVNTRAFMAYAARLRPSSPIPHSSPEESLRHESQAARAVIVIQPLRRARAAER